MTNNDYTNELYVKIILLHVKLILILSEEKFSHFRFPQYFGKSEEK